MGRIVCAVSDRFWDSPGDVYASRPHAGAKGSPGGDAVGVDSAAVYAGHSVCFPPACVRWRPAVLRLRRRALARARTGRRISDV
jgi:hypothetical protein